MNTYFKFKRNNDILWNPISYLISKWFSLRQWNRIRKYVLICRIIIHRVLNTLICILLNCIHSFVYAYNHLIRKRAYGINSKSYYSKFIHDLGVCKFYFLKKYRNNFVIWQKRFIQYRNLWTFCWRVCHKHSMFTSRQ